MSTLCSFLFAAHYMEETPGFPYVPLFLSLDEDYIASAAYSYNDMRISISRDCDTRLS